MSESIECALTGIALIVALYLLGALLDGGF